MDSDSQLIRINTLVDDKDLVEIYIVPPAPCNKNKNIHSYNFCNCHIKKFNVKKKLKYNCTCIKKSD